VSKPRQNEEGVHNGETGTGGGQEWGAGSQPEGGFHREVVVATAATQLEMSESQERRQFMQEQNKTLII
jgi:hypothetical protein